ncbi:MAG: LamG domain-containing protein, partial [Lewinella sp.]
MTCKSTLFFVLAILSAAVLHAQDPDPSINLIHAYTFEDSTVTDQVGFADGTIIGDVTFDTTAAGDVGAVLANGGVIELEAATIGINTYEAITVEAWFTPEGNQNSNFSMLVYLGGSQAAPNQEGGARLGSNGFFLQPTVNTDGGSRVAISTGNTAMPWTVETGISSDTRLDSAGTYHLLGSLDSTHIYMYLNGQLVDSTELTNGNGITALSNAFAWIGRGGYEGDASWTGTVHEVNIYNKALVPEEVAYLFDQGPTVSTTSVGELAGGIRPDIFSTPGRILFRQLPTNGRVSL